MNHKRTIKAVPELKPKEVLTMTASRTELQEWERAMRNYFRASNFHYASKKVQVSYLEERIDKSSYRLLSKLTGHHPTPMTSTASSMSSDSPWSSQNHSSFDAYPCWN